MHFNMPIMQEMASQISDPLAASRAPPPIFETFPPYGI